MAKPYRTRRPQPWQLSLNLFHHLTTTITDQLPSLSSLFRATTTVDPPFPSRTSSPLLPSPLDFPPAVQSSTSQHHHQSLSPSQHAQIAITTTINNLVLDSQVDILNFMLYFVFQFNWQSIWGL